jgi:hypothetical protein
LVRARAERETKPSGAPAAAGGAFESPPSDFKDLSVLFYTFFGSRRRAGAARAPSNDLIDPALAAHRARVVKRASAGALVEFRGVVDAYVARSRRRTAWRRLRPRESRNERSSAGPHFTCTRHR